MKTLSDFIGRIKSEQSKITVVLQAGTPVNYESYQRLVGHFQGLEEALSILDTLLDEEKRDVE
jgi:hypothetical protein|tara:strand:- start:4471 stop:4659 length:189 start_codon:yes stop_codon:yes gene_type:complete